MILTVPHQFLVPEGYKIIRKDRSETFKQKYGRNKGGGIAILHKKEIKIVAKEYMTDPVEEIFWVEVKTKRSFFTWHSLPVRIYRYTKSREWRDSSRKINKEICGNIKPFNSHWRYQY